jgi:short chain dehydrogenase
MTNPRVVLITGASSGVGQSTARLLSQRGFTVFGTSRYPSSADGIFGVEMLSLDVRADDSVRACVEAVVSRSIQVSLTEAGFLRTPRMNHRQVGARRMNEYEPWRQRALNAIRATEDRAPGPEVVADTLLGIISSGSPRLRYPIGQQAKSVARLRRFFPAGMFEQGVRRSFSLDKTQ